MIVSGGCHCGRVSFTVDIGDRVVVQRCNCSMCDMLGFLHLIVPAERFALLEGSDCLVTYRFNSGVAQHLFCSVCGVKPFYVPRSNPDGFSINLRCLELPETIAVHEEAFDGQHWEISAASLRHLTRSD